MIEARGIVFVLKYIESDKYIGLSSEEISLLHGMNLASWMLVEAGKFFADTITNR